MLDRNLRREEHRYRTYIMLEIDEGNNVFGDHIKKLGPCKSVRILIEVNDDEGYIDGSLEKSTRKMAN